MNIRIILLSERDAYAIKEKRKTQFRVVIDTSKYSTEEYLAIVDIFLNSPNPIEELGINSKITFDYHVGEILNLNNSNQYLEVTATSIQRLQDITSSEILYKEGFIDDNVNQNASLKIEARNQWIREWDNSSTDGNKWIDNKFVLVVTIELLKKYQK